jgi:hypothetical protein
MQSKTQRIKTQGQQPAPLTAIAGVTGMNVAIHQAGHAVMSCLLGIPFSDVTRKGIHRYDEWPIWAVPGSGPGFDPGRARQFVSREIGVALAGPLAQAINDDSKPYTRARGINDEAYAMEITWGFGDEQAASFAWVGTVREISRAILTIPRVWETVEDIALRLQESKILPGTLVRDIVRTRLGLAPQSDERYSLQEAQWCRMEDARVLAHGQRAASPKNTHNTLSREDVLARFTRKKLRNSPECRAMAA